MASTVAVRPKSILLLVFLVAITKPRPKSSDLDNQNVAFIARFRECPCVLLAFKLMLVL